MYAELAGALEREGVVLPEGVDVTRWGRSPSCRSCWCAARRRRRASRRPRAGRRRTTATSTSPSLVARAGKRGLALAQRLFYERVLEHAR